MKIQSLLLGSVLLLAGCAMAPVYEWPAPSETALAAHAVPTWELHPGLIADEIAYVSHVNGQVVWRLRRNDDIPKTVDLRPGRQVMTVNYIRGRVNVSTDFEVALTSGQTVLVKYDRPETTILERYQGKDKVFLWLEDKETGRPLTERKALSVSL